MKLNLKLTKTEKTFDLMSLPYALRWFLAILLVAVTLSLMALIYYFASYGMLWIISLATGLEFTTKHVIIGAIIIGLVLTIANTKIKIEESKKGEF